MPDDKDLATVRLTFAHEGAFHTEEVRISLGRLERYDRLVDLLLEDRDVSRRLYLDPERLVSAHRLDD
jgi:hypothetical protein